MLESPERGFTAARVDSPTKSGKPVTFERGWAACLWICLCTQVGDGYAPRMSQKKGKIDALLDQWSGQGEDPHYVGYFDCFNRALFYEAHDVLEQLWLAQRKQPNDHFYKGLIQLTGAFVHLQKNRLKPAAALFNLARANLEKYPAVHERLDVAVVLELIKSWLGKLELSNFAVNPLSPAHQPRLRLLESPAPIQCVTSGR